MSESKDDKGDVKNAILGGKKRSPNRLIVDEGEGDLKEIKVARLIPTPPSPVPVMSLYCNESAYML